MTPTLSRLPARPKDENENQDQVRVQSAAHTVEPAPPLRKPAGKTGPDDFPKRIKRLSENLEQATTLESLLDESVAGVRAAGLAHDFNNVLAAVKSSLVLAREARSTGPRGAEQWFEHAAGAADRARGLASQLLAVARGETPRTWKTDLGVLLRESIDFCMRGSIAIKRIDIPAGLWAIEADPGQIFQVVLNLVTNAKCAMPTGGKLGVRAWNRCVPGGRLVSFSISDTGTGIRPEDMRRIFTPGFTTKPCGSGIGMATCRAIVHRHGGSIRVESIPGDRTVVEVTLPAVDQNMTP